MLTEEAAMVFYFFSFDKYNKPPTKWLCHVEYSLTWMSKMTLICEMNYCSFDIFISFQNELLFIVGDKKINV